MIKTKVAFLEGRRLSNQLEQSEKLSKSLIGWKKAGPPKIHFCFDHVNRLQVNENVNAVLTFCLSFSFNHDLQDHHREESLFIVVVRSIFLLITSG